MKKEESEIKAGIRTSDDDTYSITAAEHHDGFLSEKSPTVTTGYSSNSVTKRRIGKHPVRLHPTTVDRSVILDIFLHSISNSVEQQ
jgi:hypothetical protein